MQYFSFKRQPSILDVAIFTDSISGDSVSDNSRLRSPYTEESLIKEIEQSLSSRTRFKKQPDIGAIVSEMIDAIHSDIDVVLTDISLVRGIFNEAFLDRYMRMYDTFDRGLGIKVRENYRYIKKAKAILSRVGKELKIYKTISVGHNCDDGTFVVFISESAKRRFGTLEKMGLNSRHLQIIYLHNHNVYCTSQ